MSGKTLLSSAYLPPVEYFALIKGANEILIEREENYHKQTFRNRCKILTSNGPLVLSVPVINRNLPKTGIKDIEIDYSKRWQQVHIRAITSSYSSSPYFQYYFENIEKIIHRNHKFLLDLNMDLLMATMEILKMNKRITYTTVFEPVIDLDHDFRYRIIPKAVSNYAAKEYFQVFNKSGFVPGLTIIDLIFNMGPESEAYL